VETQIPLGDLGFFMGGESMERRLGVVGIVVGDRKTMASKVNEILSEHGDIIAGRMGIPHPGRKVAIISLIVDGTTDELGSLTGKLGMLKGVHVCSSLIRG
jgi:putative iron-only hydrogenase system regulator